MVKRKLVEKPHLQVRRDDAETSRQIKKRMKIGERAVMDLLWYYKELGTLRMENVPGTNIRGYPCITTVYWVEDAK